MVINQYMGSLGLLHCVDQRCVTKSTGLIVVEMEEEICFADDLQALFFLARINQ